MNKFNYATLIAVTALVVSACDSGGGSNRQVNTPPVLTKPNDQNISANVSSAAIGFSIVDQETAANNLTVSATSSNTALLPASGIALGGSGANRTITLTPNNDLTGDVQITLAVVDADGAAATDTFSVSIIAQQVFFSQLVRDQFEKSANDEPIGLNALDIQQDVEDPAAFDDLLNR